jgi:phosphoserine phosphatase RsbU/P
MHILIAEDDFLSRKLLQTNLRDMGHTVDVAENGDQAWEMYDNNPYRVVVSDWLMPGLDGLEFCKKVRNRPNTEYAYFILLTANVSDENNYYEAMESGVDDFLSKPLNRNELGIRLRVAQRILKDTSRIKSLENVLTICAYTKKVKLADDDWLTIEEFIDSSLGLKMTHGISPDYYNNVILPEMEKLRSENKKKNH